MKRIWVRVLPNKNNETFSRCGMQFTSQWSERNVDDATKSALQAEQMLEVTEENPVNPAPVTVIAPTSSLIKSS